MNWPQPIQIGWAWSYSRSTNPRLQTQSNSYLKGRMTDASVIHGSIESIVQKKGGKPYRHSMGQTPAWLFPTFTPGGRSVATMWCRAGWRGGRARGREEQGTVAVFIQVSSAQPPQISSWSTGWSEGQRIWEQKNRQTYSQRIKGFYHT